MYFGFEFASNLLIFIFMYSIVNFLMRRMKNYRLLSKLINKVFRERSLFKYLEYIKNMMFINFY